MSFDIFLQRFPPDPLPEKAVTAVRAVLQRTTHTGPDSFGFYVIAFADGASVEFSAEGLDGSQDFSGCAFHLHGMTSQVISFILAIARAGDFVILPAMENFVPILSHPSQRTTVPKDLPEAVLCESSAELEALLTGGYSAWRRYRDHIVKNA